MERNPFFCPNAALVPELENYMDALRKSGDSIGARIDIIANGVAPGWGEPVYDRLDADIAAAMMSINAVKGVQIGAGFGAVEQRGTEHRDEITPKGFLSNHAGGILGGISTGQAIEVSIALKPTPICTPFTALMLIIAAAMSASSRSYTGSPHPGATPLAMISIRAPMESPDLRSASM